MKKNILFTPAILTAGILLAGCGTADLAGDEPDAVDPVETPAETTDTDVEETEDQSDAPEDTDGTSGDSHDAPDGELTMSDQQAYQLYVLDGYAFTAEEPNRDVVFLEENDAVFMRIETYYPSDISFDDLAANTQDTVQASNPDAEVQEFTGFDGSSYSQSAAYEVETAEGHVTGIAFEGDNIIVRVTIFDHSTIEARDDFIEMAQTIERVQK
ncbi:hypothetical protein [Planococcus sp. ISL-109]|uniref:hypothetical protein n=1 Tax=Planococcus sp. ISL-109 TaxID=2819166 RepID=UPI001BE9ABC6|nr:hypothetical protein [Planococcus sp. ISL-109]MBT2581779.1 hypothetical protein [Planococcus sp. ISL-109]